MRDECIKAALLCLGALFCLGCALLQVEKGPADAIRAPEGMVYVPPGKVKVRVFEKRHEHGAWRPHHEIEKVSEGFFIDKYEFPNAKGELPLGNVSFVEAQGMCAEQGKRLCTMHEWLKACQGPKMTRYHYGNEHKIDQSDLGELPPSPQRSGTGKFSESGYGACDMCGNLWEWTSQPAIERYCGYTNPAKRLLLGGCGGFDGYAASVCNDMTGNLKDYSYRTFGFRCCLDAE